MSLSVERLEHLVQSKNTGKTLRRIGLSATVKPIVAIANFLGPSTAEEPVKIINIGHRRQLDLSIATPDSELSAVCSLESWEQVYDQIVTLISKHQSTIIFVNTRRLAERLTHQLSQRIDGGSEVLAAHHGSLSRSIRHSAEHKLKTGQLKAIVATASLELGIDVGFVDLVIQIGSPRSIATFLQRVGRSGHFLKGLPKGILFALTRDELLECIALLKAIHEGELDEVIIPHAAMDILAQQVIAASVLDEWDEAELYSLVKKSWFFRDLKHADFEDLLSTLADGYAPERKKLSWIYRDQINKKIRARRGTNLAVLTNSGAIPELALRLVR